MPPKRKGKKNKSEPKLSLKERITEILEFPKELILNIAKLTILGNQSLVIENYKGVIEYTDSIIRINTNNGVIKITGNRLVIKEITLEDVIVFGMFDSIEFLK